MHLDEAAGGGQARTSRSTAAVLVQIGSGPKSCCTFRERSSGEERNRLWEEQRNTPTETATVSLPHRGCAPCDARPRWRRGLPRGERAGRQPVAAHQRGVVGLQVQHLVGPVPGTWPNPSGRDGSIESRISAMSAQGSGLAAAEIEEPVGPGVEDRYYGGGGVVDVQVVPYLLGPGQARLLSGQQAPDQVGDHPARVVVGPVG